MRRGAEFQVGQLTLELEVDTYRSRVGLPTTVEDAQKAAREDAVVIGDEKKSKRKGALVQ